MLSTNEITVKHYCCHINDLSKNLRRAYLRPTIWQKTFKKTFALNFQRQNMYILHFFQTSTCWIAQICKKLAPPLNIFGNTWYFKGRTYVLRRSNVVKIMTLLQHLKFRFRLPMTQNSELLQHMWKMRTSNAHSSFKMGVFFNIVRLC